MVDWKLCRKHLPQLRKTGQVEPHHTTQVVPARLCEQCRMEQVRNMIRAGRVRIKGGTQMDYIKGPWKRTVWHDDNDDVHEAIVAVQPSGAEYLVCEFRNGVNRYADSSLVSAAPDMHDALKMAVEIMKDHNLDEYLAGEFEIITDAIAKAEGTDAD